MEYNKIISVTGLGGLYELLSSKNDGALVRSLEDKSTKFVSSRIHQFSHLESIEIFTIRENVNLQEVFVVMKSAGTALPSEKDAAAIKKYFEQVYPDMDFDRVYASDLKKIIRWYGILTNNNIDFTPKEEVAVEEEVVAVETKEEAPKAKKSAKKKEVSEEVEAEEKPVKKAAKKKAEPKAESADTTEEAPKKKRATKKAEPKEE